jgi:FkbM family methyltransferase
MYPPLSIRLYGALMRRLPIRSGLTALSFNRIVEALLPASSAPVRASYLDGTPVEVSLSDHDGRILYLFGTNDPKVSQVSCALLRKGDVFLDIGANHASIGLQASHAVGTQGRVHLFEPQSALCQRVQRAIDAGRYPNVQLHRVGLLDKDGAFDLFAPERHSGMATFAGLREDGHGLLEVCDVRSISSYVAPLVAGRCFGAKLDVEGAEPRIMPWLLAQPNLRFLVFEAAQNREQLFDLVRAAALTLYGLRRHPLRLQLVHIGGLAQLGAYHDVIAIRLPAGVHPPATVHPRSLARLLERRVAPQHSGIGDAHGSDRPVDERHD